MYREKTRLLFLIGNLGTGGQERQMTELIRGLSTTGDYEIHVIIKSKTSKSIKLGLSHYYDKIKESAFNLTSLNQERFNFSTFLKFVREVLCIKPDIVHSWSKTTTTIAIFSKFFFFKNFKIIDGSIRNSFPISQRGVLYKIEKLIHYALANSIVTNTKSALSAYRIPNRKGMYIYNGYNLLRNQNLKDKKSLKHELNIVTKFVVGMVGNFDSRKDYSTYLCAANEILSKRNDVTFIAIGEGQDLEFYKESYQNDRIVFTGMRSDVESIVQIFTCGVLLSNPSVHSEGISNSIMEYMSLSKPVIATKSSGNSELVLNRKTGFLIDKNNIKCFVEKINYLLDNEKESGQLGYNGYEILINQFSFDKMIQNYVFLYNDLIYK